MQITLPRVLVVSTVLVMTPVVGWAQHGDLTHGQPATPDANVDFGVLPLPTAALGPPPCLQPTTPPALPAPIGSPADPCAYKIHHLTPEEVTIEKGGEVTFQIHGGGHAMAIYEVSKDTTRDGIGQYLCVGFDRKLDSGAHPCLNFPPAGTPVPPGPGPGVANAAANHNVADGKGHVVIVSGLGGAAHPNNRIWSEPGRLMAAGGHQFLNGGTIPAGPTSNGELIAYRFLKTGRYLVICANRSHFLNDWMFGFVNVIGE